MSRVRYTNNLLGALAVGLTDRMGEAMDRAWPSGGRAGAALLCIGTRPDQSIDQLARILDLSHSATVRLVDRLEQDGLITRGRLARDGRSVSLRLTRTGRGTFERLLNTRNAAIGEVTGVLGARDRRTLERLLTTMLAAMPADQAHARTICRLCEHAVCPGDACPVGSAV